MSSTIIYKKIISTVLLWSLMNNLVFVISANDNISSLRGGRGLNIKQQRPTVDYTIAEETIDVSDIMGIPRKPTSIPAFTTSEDTGRYIRSKEKPIIIDPDVDSNEDATGSMHSKQIVDVSESSSPNTTEGKNHDNVNNVANWIVEDDEEEHLPSNHEFGATNFTQMLANKLS